MSVEDEAMRWLYALSLRPGVFALDLALGVLLIVFVVAAWRLTSALAPRRFDTNASHARPLRPATRLDGASALGNAGTVVRPDPAPTARGLVAGRRSSTAFRAFGSRSSTGT
jgi:hypothetical protein